MADTDIVTYAITIYAVLPTIVIVLLFSFLTDLDRQVAQYESMLLDKGHPMFTSIRNRLREVDKFIIVSSRYLHLTMSFYLLFLLGSFAIVVLVQYKLLIINIIMIIYFLYATFYILNEVATIDKLNLNHKVAYYGISLIAFYLIPIGLLCGPNIIFLEKSFYLLWVAINISQIALWWLIFPVKDKPLKKLNEVSKEILNIENTGKGVGTKPNIISLLSELEVELATSWKYFIQSSAYNELVKIHDILSNSSHYSREDRCSEVPYPPYHLGAQNIGKNVNKILLNYGYTPHDIFPGQIKDSIEYESENKNMIRRFCLKISNVEHKNLKLFIEFEHSHDEYIFLSEPKVFVR